MTPLKAFIFDDPAAAYVNDILPSRDLFLYILIQLLELMVETVRPTAARIGSEDELDDLLELWNIGPGYVRQRRIVEAGGSMRDVVDTLIGELESDQPTTP